MERTRPSGEKCETGAFSRGCRGYSYVCSASLHGDDWDRRFNFRKVPGTIHLWRYTDSVKLSCLGQVYAYLKRLGYVVTRVKQPTPSYPIPPPYPSPATPVHRKSLIQLALYPIKFMLSRIAELFTPAFSWWKPIIISPLLGINMNYRWSDMLLDSTALTVSTGSIFRALRFVPRGHGIPLKTKPQPSQAEDSPYAHFFNVYKPNTPYKKTSPPIPDFAISVVR